METAEEASEILPQPQSALQKPSLLRIIAASCSYMTVQLSFGFVFALFTPLMTNDLEVPVTWTPILWWIGPLSGLLQPFLGAWSDSSPCKWGRRRPFILCGTMIVVAGYILFYFVKSIGNALGDHDHSHPAGISIAIIAMITLNIAINVVMGPGRAIVCDLSAGREALGNSMISLMIGAANLISNMVVFGITSSTTPFIIGICLVVVSVIPTLLFAKERPFIRGEKKTTNPCVKIFRALRTMRGPVLRACVVFFLSWAAYFPFATNATTFVGLCIYNRTHTSLGTGAAVATVPLSMPLAPGVPLNFFSLSPASRPYFASLSSDAFEEGKRVGAAAIAASSLVTAIFSSISTWLMNLIGLKVTYFAAQLIATGAYLGLFFATTTAEVFIHFCLIGINFSLFNSVPFALVAEAVSEEDAGLYAGGMNIFCVAAQFISLAVNSIVGAIWPNNLEVVMLGCALLSLIATLLVPILKRGSRKAGTNLEPATTRDDERVPLTADQFA